VRFAAKINQIERRNCSKSAQQRRGTPLRAAPHSVCAVSAVRASILKARFPCALPYAGRRTDFRDKKSSDFSARCVYHKGKTFVVYHKATDAFPCGIFYHKPFA